MKNTFFEAMKAQAEAYAQEKAAREAVKKALIARYREASWDEEDQIDAELKAWHEEEKKHPFPFSDGACKAYRAYFNSQTNQSSDFEVSDLPWEKDYEDFVGTLRAAGIKTFVVTDKSTALMDGIHELTSRGCKLIGPAVITRKEFFFGSYQETEHRGLVFQVI
jgi:hypothetical protein